MPEIVLTCPLCGNNCSQVFDEREFRGQSITNRMCLTCGLVFQSPRMTEDESKIFYAKEYRQYYEGSEDPTSHNLKDQRGRAESLYKFIQLVVPVINRHLDIGCSFGVLLLRFTESYHSQSFGIEPGMGHRAQAIKEGLTVYETFDNLEKHEKERFDLVSLSHVLEHLPDPVGYLVHLRESFLTPDSWLLLEVPNLYAHDSFEVAHLVSYSSLTLQQTLEKAGFGIIKQKKHGWPRSNLLPLYLTVLAKPLPIAQQCRNLIPEKQVALKRCVGIFWRRLLERLFPKQAWLR
jgi:SAM-dependent methyltransferase